MMKIDQEDFNRKAQHILDTVVKPQVEKYEKAKAEGELTPKPRQLGTSGWIFEEYARKVMGDMGGMTDIEQAADRISREHYVDQSDYWAVGVDSFKRGVKWQQEKQKITLSYFRRVYQDFVDEKITMSRMVELLNEREEE